MRFKRMMDILSSAAGLILFAPLGVLISVAILADSGWPVFFAQQRIGRRFIPFSLYKFRSMRAASEGPAITIHGDTRVTRVGRFLRASKLDELPQLWNVLRGEMSLVGPRPEVLQYVEQFRDQYCRILQFRPGITDPASIAFANEEEMLAAAVDPHEAYVREVLPTKLRLSEEYVARWSLWLDLELIVRTLSAVAARRRRREGSHRKSVCAGAAEADGLQRPTELPPPTPGQLRSRSILLIGNFIISPRRSNISASEELARQLEEAGWRVSRASAKASRVARFIDILRAVWVGRRQTAVAHIALYSGPAFLWAQASASLLRILSIPYVVTLHGGNLPQFATRHSRRVRRLLQAAAVVTAPSRYLADALRGYCAGIQCLPNGLDLGRYPFVLRRAAAPKCAWLRSLHLIYNPRMVVDTVARLVGVYPDIDVTIIGPEEQPGLRQELFDYAERSGIVGNLRFLGGIPKERVPAELAQSDIFLNTTNVDNTPMSVLEAMACGLCVVTTNAGGIPALVEHGRSGLVVPRGDAAAMAAAVAAIIENPQLAARLSNGGRKVVEAADWSVVRPRWCSVFDSVANGGPERRTEHSERAASLER